MAKCEGCRDGFAFDHAISMAFQPITHIRTGRVFAHEALVRGVGGESAGAILARVDDSNLYAFDQRCRVTAIDLANRLGLAADGAYLSINFMPNAVYEPRACIRLTLATAAQTGFPLNRLIFEFTEAERIDTDHLLNILHTYREMGFKTAIDDFGAGYSGLGLLAKFQPDIVKLDMELIRGIDRDGVKRRIVSSLLKMLKDLGVEVVCEGVETDAELATLRELGATLVQGYAIARPAFERLAKPDLALAD
ncbi:EAL domain-containing protein [Phenylobacterium sp.]|uniref:EAL domain-containing protein n=1 Tax=Phenylobacterium sp. TaxID=1871053 RepID=UPI0035B1718F